MGNKKDSGKIPVGQSFEDFRLREEQTAYSTDRSKNVRAYDQFGQLPKYQEYGHMPIKNEKGRTAHESKLEHEVTALVDYIASRGLSIGEATVVLLQAGFQVGSGLSADVERMAGGFHGNGRRDN